MPADSAAVRAVVRHRGDLESVPEQGEQQEGESLPPEQPAGDGGLLGGPAAGRPERLSPRKAGRVLAS